MSDERNEQEKHSQRERHLYLVRSTPRDQGRRSFWRNPWAWSSLAIFLVLISGAAMLNRAAGRPNPELSNNPAQQGSLVDFRDVEEPLNANTIQRHIRDVQNALEEPNWAAAEENVSELWNAWLAFRPRMQAQAGTEIWDTPDVSTFETALRQLVDSVEHRELTIARERTETLRTITEKYTQVQSRLREDSVYPYGLDDQVP